jgi:hypothetical protein
VHRSLDNSATPQMRNWMIFGELEPASEEHQSAPCAPMAKALARAEADLEATLRRVAVLTRSILRPVAEIVRFRDRAA